MPISDEMVEAAHKSLWSSKHWGLPDVRRALEAAEAVRDREDQPVAYLKQWVGDAGAECERVDLHDRLEPWLADKKPKITPLFASSGGNRE